jgi:hypothetical protein
MSYTHTSKTHIAISQVKTLVSVLLREFEFEMIDKKLPELNYDSMVAGPKGTVMVNYKRRTATAAK